MDADEAQDRLHQGLPSKEDRFRAGYGSLEMSLQTVEGLCPSRRCVFKAGHSQPCWPKERP